MSLGKTRVAAGVALVVSMLTLLAFAQSALAATVTTPDACYVSESFQEELEVPVSGSGFTPTSQSVEKVDVKILGPDDALLGYEYFTVADDGSFSGVIDNTFTPFKEAGAGQFKIIVEGLRSSEIYAEGPIWLAEQGLRLSADKNVKPRDKVTFDFAGLKSGAPVFAHYVRKGKEVLSQQLGTTSGPCGTLHVKAKLFPAKHTRFASYTVQFDDEKDYTPKADPKLVFDLKTGRF